MINYHARDKYIYPSIIRGEMSHHFQTFKLSLLYLVIFEVQTQYMCMRSFAGKF